MRINKNINLILFLVCIKLSFGQINNTYIYRWGVDKPNLKQDTFALVKNNITTISVYEVHAIDSGKWGKQTLIASWNLKNNKAQITSSTIKKERPEFNYPFESLNKATDRWFSSKNYIIECIGKDELKLKLTHFLNDSNQITQTVCKCINCKYESRYNGIGKIEYKYSNGLLYEAIYYGDDKRIIKDFPYSKFVFYYSSDTISTNSR